jgi:hypothetical protein
MSIWCRRKEPILRLLNLQLQRQRFSNFKAEENIFVVKTHWATRGVVNIYNAGVVADVCRIGSRVLKKLTQIITANVALALLKYLSFISINECIKAGRCKLN